MAHPKNPALPSLFIAVPCFRSQLYVNCVQSLIALTSTLSAAGVRCEVRFITSTLVGLARNEIAGLFLESDCSHLLMLDDDIGGFQPDEIATLLSVDVGALPCPYRRRATGFALNLHQEHVDSGEIPSVEVNGKRLIEVQGVGTGVMCIRRGVFTRMIETLGAELAYSTDATYAGSERPHARLNWDFFSMGPDRSEADPSRRGYVGEDMSFCRRWQKLGGKIHVLVGAHPTHFGAHEFTSDPKTLSIDFASWLRVVLTNGPAAAARARADDAAPCLRSVDHGGVT